MAGIVAVIIQIQRNQPLTCSRPPFSPVYSSRAANPGCLFQPSFFFGSFPRSSTRRRKHAEPQELAHKLAFIICSQARSCVHRPPSSPDRSNPKIKAATCGRRTRLGPSTALEKEVCRQPEPGLHQRKSGILLCRGEGEGDGRRPQTRSFFRKRIGGDDARSCSRHGGGAAGSTSR